METAGDSGNPKWLLLGYKLPHRALSGRIKDVTWLGGRAVGQGAGAMQRGQDFQNKQRGRGLEGILP